MSARIFVAVLCIAFLTVAITGFHFGGVVALSAIYGAALCEWLRERRRRRKAESHASKPTTAFVKALNKGVKAKVPTS